jgi:pyruvate/2-oxoglutarate dehydrogenase complex dihydrolipoamide acyltransferase (E2) component
MPPEPTACAPQTLCLVIGGIAGKPAMADGRVEPCEILNLTVTFDHNMVDGAPAARFVRQLLDLIENAYRLILGQPALHSHKRSVVARPASLLA